MIDEELYELAAAELNSDKRKPQLWARACALASDDHDEARYLYTNLRVEELLTEREAPPHSTVSSDVAGTPDFDPSMSADTESPADTAELTDSLSHGDDSSTEDPFDNLRLQPMDGAEAPVASSQTGIDSSPTENSLSLDELQEFSAGDDSRPTSIHTEQRLDLHDADVELDPSSVMQMNDAEPGALSSIDGRLRSDADDADLESEIAALGDGDSTAKIPSSEVSWLDEKIRAEREAAERETRRVANETDSLAEDLVRQTAEFERDTGVATVAATAADEPSNSLDAHAEADIEADMDAVIDAESNSAADADTAADTGADTALIETHVQDAGDYQHDSIERAEVDDFAQLRVGGRKNFLVYSHFAGKSRAVKQGGSWPALFFTFPWLLSRGMLGTALLYALLWIVLLSALLWTGLAWLDAGADASMATKLWTVGFAALAVIGLLYIPFRSANTWYARKLERRGYEFQSDVSANNPRQAVNRFLDYLD